MGNQGTGQTIAQTSPQINAPSVLSNGMNAMLAPPITVQAANQDGAPCLWLQEHQQPRRQTATPSIGASTASDGRRPIQQKRTLVSHETLRQSGSPTVSNNTTAMLSLVQDPSVWVTKIPHTPDLGDLLYAFSILPFAFRVILAIALLPLVGPVVWFADTVIVPIVLLLIWRLDYTAVPRMLSSTTQSLFHRLPTFVADHYAVFLAPFCG